MTDTIGHQGHPGRFAPWRWERQCDAYSAAQNLSWMDTAIDREAWQAHLFSWVAHMMGHKLLNAIVGNL
eukprot:2655474-Pyramimonas_sp.AAC.1